MNTIIKGATILTPELVLGYQVGSEVPTRKHRILDGTIAHTLTPAEPRTGTLSLFFLTYTSALTAFDTHRQLGTFQFTDAARPAATMKYVVVGRLTLTLDDTTRTRWTVDVPFEETLA